VLAALVVVPGTGVPTGALYTVLLMAHVASAVVGFAALGASAFFAACASAGPEGPRAEAVRRYFRPGVNWPGRALYAVPVLGFALVAASGGAFEVDDVFVLAGLGLWVAAIAVAEGVVWPAERRLQRMVAEDWEQPGAGIRWTSRAVVIGALVDAVSFVAATVVMVGKP
jgi:Predicted integral membrane protein (DUF2269)